MKNKIIILIIALMFVAGCAHVRVPRGDGSCPADFPVKGNADSFVYHTPASLFYLRTKAEICFDSKGAAERHGYRQSRY